MKLYRVTTENKNYPDILEYLDREFLNGYTIISANRGWQGKREKSLIIEITGNQNNINMKVGHLAYWLKKHNKQNAVLVQDVNIESQLL